MFVAGLVVGAVAASFFMGFRSDDPDSIGRGISQLISQSKDRSGPPPEPTVEPKSSITTDYDFYMVLPEIEHIIPPQPEIADTPPPKPAATSTALSTTTTGVDSVVSSTPPKTSSSASTARPTSAQSGYVLQAGAYARLEDADRLKAKLALKGLESRIQKVTIEGRGTFFRVRLGPFASTESLRTADATLLSMGIKSLRLKVSGG